jgi:hypothetical protein
MQTASHEGDETMPGTGGRGRSVGKTTKRKYVVDVGLGISFFLCFATGIVKLPGFVEFFNRASIDFPMDRITALHDGSGMILGILVLVHLVLNRRWIVSVTGKLLAR